MNIISNHLIQIKQLCNDNSVKSLFAFGSVTRNDFSPASDIDLLVDIESNDPIEYAEKYFSLKFQLESIFKREIDLLEYKSVSNPYLKNEIDRTKVLVYGK